MKTTNSSIFKTLKKRSLMRCSKQIREQKAPLYIIWFKTLKKRSQMRCSKQIREQKARLYIIWKCTMFLIRSHD
ncbi:hypothetical protein HanPI659440_Chr04g0169941 [Helianthus annuus]|nr:hypothetical protein HanHA89_Chr04g0159351 [Helianthus annuus]KAJ0797095.1 hypothetical protein HanPI659440_Chr04g0169941 [Helianthus annuus]KAJ0932313.1 hypothetical protein HanPSC8_Chr04g0172221 [Helianthus annuus]